MSAFSLPLVGEEMTEEQKGTQLKVMARNIKCVTLNIRHTECPGMELYKVNVEA